MPEINDDQLDRLGKLADTAENYEAMAGNHALRDSVHREMLADGMRQIAAEVKELYREISGEDPWE